ncbi:MAG: methyltransferase [Acidobacteriota bacterium]
MPDAVHTLLEVSMSTVVPRCLHVVANLGVADALSDSPRSAEDLAADCGADAGALGRALRLLAAYGIFESRDGAWAHTEASRLLRADHPQSLRSFVRMIGMDIQWRTMESLAHSIRTGKSSAEAALPGGMWKYMSEHPEESKLFDDSMRDKARGQVFGILAKYDFSPFKTIADIGGGGGHLLKAVIEATPNASGVLFDLPHVTAKVAESPRLRTHPGDFFKDQIPDCDAYMIMQVIHDWSDEESARILKAIRNGAHVGSRLLLIEAIMPEDAAPSWVKMLDIFMLASLTGKERTRAQYDVLLKGAGFRLDRVIDIGQDTSILEATAI